MSNDDDFYDENGEWIECWNCGGEGSYADCDEEFACADPESGCDLCTRRCSVCKGQGGWKPKCEAVKP